MKRNEWIVVGIALLAVVAKLYCAWTTIGTADIAFFSRFAETIANRGVKAAFDDPMFNHAPLLTEYLGVIWPWSEGHGRIIARYIRVPCIVADFAVVLILLWFRRRTGRPALWAIGLLAASPVSFMVSGYHGNVDPVVVLGIVAVTAAAACGQPALAGLFLGLTCQIKVVPLLIVPIFFFHFWHRQKALPFSLATGLALLAGWITPLLIAPHAFARQVLAYSSTWGWWGFTYLLRLSGVPEFFSSLPPYSSAQMAVISLCKVIIIGSVLTLAWRRRAAPPESLFSTVAFAFLFFLVFAPGFGVQYLVYLAPFLLLVSERWFAAALATSTAGAFAFYHSISGGFPWDRGFIVQPHIGTWGPWLLLAWTTLAACFVAQARLWLRRSTPVEARPEPSEAKPA